MTMAIGVLVVVVICVKIGDCPNADLHFAARKAPILTPTHTIQAYTLWQSPSIWVRCGENVGSNMFSAVHNHLTDVTLTPCLLHVFRKLSVVGPVSPTDLLYLCHRPNPSRLATVIWDAAKRKGSTNKLTKLRINTSGWWFQPLWKILVSWGYYSQYMEK